MFIFFFSSRRRHTRYWRDWSSDVCSSDLNPDRGHPVSLCTKTGLPWTRARSVKKPWNRSATHDMASAATRSRSEERRVGKSVDLGGRRIIKKKKKHILV